MKTSKNIAGFVSAIATNLLLAIIFVLGINLFIEVPVLPLALTIISAFAIYTFVFKGQKTNRFAFMALQQEIWVPFIQEKLFPENSFLEKSMDHSEFIKYKTVHLPQAAATPGMVLNNTSLPLDINQRLDTDFTYQIDNYKIVPYAVSKLEELQASYPKMESVMGSMYRQAGYGVANIALHNWAPSGSTRMVRTSGSAVSTALSPGATGNRNALTLADIAALKNIMDADFVPEEDRYIIIPSSMYNNQLLAINNIQAFYAYNRPTLQDGKAPTIFGFNVIVRPSTQVFDNSGTPIIKTLNTDTSATGGLGFGLPATTASDDNMAVFAWHKDFIAKAKQEVQLYFQANRPDYYGDIMSAELQFGASPLRSDGVGTAVLVQQ